MESRRSGVTIREMLALGAICAVAGLGTLSFLKQASTAANLSKVHADLKTYAIALEAYNVDQGDYPPQTVISGPSLQFDLERTLIPLSTPIAYMADALLPEPFNARQGAALYAGWDLLNTGTGPPDAATRKTIYWYLELPPDAGNPVIEMFLITLIQSNAPPGVTFTPADFNALFGRRWYMASPGPDGYYSFDPCFGGISSNVAPCLFYENATMGLVKWDGYYDPTNGLISGGEVIRARETPPPTPRPPNAAREWSRYE